MKNCFIAAALFAAVGSSSAQGYMGAVVALTNFSASCTDPLVCHDKGHGIKLYAGSRLDKEYQLDIGVGKIDAVEVGVVNFGKGRLNYSQQFIDANTSNVYAVDAATVNTANALIGAFVMRMPVVDQLAFLVKPGIAYVSSTQRYYVQGVQNGSETATKLKPYLGLGVEYGIVDNVKIVGAIDWTQFDVAGQKANIYSFGLGAEVGF